MISSLGKSIHKEVLINHPFFKTAVDDRLKWIPFSTVFFLDLLGVKTRSGWKRQVLITGATEAIRYMICDNLKKLVHEHRPASYEGNNHSFPSGHTASSFAGAEFMCKELKGSMPLLSCAGYVGATAVAVIRLMEDRHWLRDVVAGAAIGIISAKLAYRLSDKRNKKTSDVNENMHVDPDNVHKTFRALNEMQNEE
jgi:membrane-associated phospholipid phosphatase